MTGDDLAAELDEVRERARRRYRRRMPAVVVVTAALTIAFVVWLPDDTKERDAPDWLSFVDAAAVVLLLGYGIAIWLRARRARRPLFQWRQGRPLALGLPRRQRREVARDIRRGTPNNDPLLRAVEQAEVERLRPIVDTGLSYFPFMVGFLAYQGVRQAVLHDPVHGAPFFCLAALMLWSGLYTLRSRRGMRAFD